MILKGDVPEVPKLYTIISAQMKISQPYLFLFWLVLAVEKFGTGLPEKLEPENLRPLTEMGSYLVSRNTLNSITSVYLFTSLQCIYFIQKCFLLNVKDIKYRINKIYGLTLYILCICIYILRLAWQSKHSTKSKWTSRQDINSSPGMRES